MWSFHFLSASTGLFLRAGAQAVSLLIVTKLFSVSEYGAISALVAMTTMLSPLAGFGMETVLVRRVVADRVTFKGIWAKALITVFFSSIILGGLVAAIFQSILPGVVASSAVLAVAISDLLFGRWLDCCSRAYLAHDQGSIAAWVPSCVSVTRALGLLALLLSGQQVNILDWALVYSLGAMLPSLVVVLVCSLKFGHPKPHLEGWGAALREGLVFSLDQTVERGRADADKVILADVQGTESAGFYALAYRFVSLAAIPINGFLYITYNRFFIEGLKGPRAVLRYTLNRIPISLVMVILVTLSIALTSPALISIFGEDYRQSSDILPFLALLLPLLLLRQLFANGLVGAGFERVRLVGGIGATILNLSINFLLIPEFGWMAAVFSAIASEAALTIFYIAVLTRLQKYPVVV